MIGWERVVVDSSRSSTLWRRQKRGSANWSTGQQRAEATEVRQLDCYCPSFINGGGGSRTSPCPKLQYPFSPSWSSTYFASLRTALSHQQQHPRLQPTHFVPLLQMRMVTGELEKVSTSSEPHQLKTTSSGIFLSGVHDYCSDLHCISMSVTGECWCLCHMGNNIRIMYILLCVQHLHLCYFIMHSFYISLQ